MPDQKNGRHTARLLAVQAMVDHKRPNAPTAQRRALYAILEDMASLAGFAPLFYRRNPYVAGSQFCGPESDQCQDAHANIGARQRPENVGNRGEKRLGVRHQILAREKMSEEMEPL